ncbi:Mov34/MPN/PAD-1 family protein [Streptomyces sp. 6N223]|uniref:Mov34/MPN/PAD-1 family protein n=1 Tax=Streptomyces sp. 6N223 TaxID=3457412 RepID=UPI003FCF1C89
MLTITQDLCDRIVAHAREDHPDEACGVIAGPEGSDRPERFVPMMNEDRSPTGFKFESGELLALHKEMYERDEEIVVVYHSHTATEAYPSRTDVTTAKETTTRAVHWVVISTALCGNGEGPVPFRSFHIAGDIVVEEEVRIVDSYDDVSGASGGSDSM